MKTSRPPMSSGSAAGSASGSATCSGACPSRRGRLKDGSRPYLLAPVEFQSTVDRTMAQRMRDYVEMLRERLAKAGVAERGLPRVLPIVVYSGAERWTASGGMDDLAPLPSSAARLALAPYQ